MMLLPVASILESTNPRGFRAVFLTPSRHNRCARGARTTLIVMASWIALIGTVRAQEDKAAAEQHALIGVAKNHATLDISTNPAKQWFPESGLGLFIHWGISSVSGKHDLSWGMMGNYVWCKTPLTPEAYWKQAEQFQPQEYHPEKWLKAAKDAGFGYAVLTTRHHDGYALWPSAYGEFSTRTKMDGRDLVREYVDACRKVGLRVGLYYSVPDWYFHRETMSFGYESKGTADSPHLGMKHESIQLPVLPVGFEDKFVAYVNGQINELMTRYGKIDLLWFDGGAGLEIISQEKIRTMQPDAIINDRAHGVGDFHAGPECQFPTKRLPGVWEYCGGLTSCWGYQARDEGQHPNSVAREVLVALAKCRPWGGNALLNCGPRPTGEMPDCYYRGMEIVKEWMTTHRESVYGVQAGPYPEQSNVPITVRGKTWYAMLLPTIRKDDPAVLEDGRPIVLTGVEKPQQVTWLGTGQSLESQFEKDRLTIFIPKNLRTQWLDVVKLAW